MGPLSRRLLFLMLASQRSGLYVRPLRLREARELVARWHRHHAPPRGHLFSLGAWLDGEPRGVCIVGRPVARHLDDGLTCEVTRLATDGTPNACSLLLGAARRVAREMGFASIVTYTLPVEGGASLRAAGWCWVGVAGGGSWNHASRPRQDKAPTCPKWRWSCALGSASPPSRRGLGTRPEPQPADSAPTG